MWPLAVACLLGTGSLPAQVTVQDSTGAPVPFAVLESATGRRVVADAQGVARAARAADGPWLARRIGYRPARGEPGAERIVLARLPAALPAVRVASFTELHERRALHAETRPSMSFRFVTELVAEDGQVLEGDDDVIPIPVAPANRAYVPGRAIEREEGEWTVRRPRLLDLASPAFLEAHCLVIDDSADDSTTVLRFLHRVGLSGPQINGAYVIDRRSGRLRSDTLDYVQPPRGAPGRARFVSTYVSADE
ncbi:MAG: hypothetical protein MUD17_07155, partial [Gemmatimonadaceae bacterium]|nr:hypothetical protein [Gemmatimonadaceae bacterium]